MKLFSSTSVLNILAIFAMLVFGAQAEAEAQGYEIYFGGLTETLNKDDFGEAVISLDDGGYLLVGSSESFGDDNDMDVYVVRIDVDGRLIWSTIFDEGWQEFAYNAKETSNGNFIITGSISNTPGAESDAYFLEIDPDGNLLWSSQYGQEGSDVAFDVAESPVGGYVFAGRLEKEEAEGGDEFLVIKTDAVGEVEWTRELGGDETDEARSIIALEDGYIVYGQDETTQGDNAYLVKLDFAGTVVWEETYAFADNNYGQDLILTQDGALALTGFQANPGESSQAFLLKVSAEDGSVIWFETIGGELTDQAYEVTETEEGDLVIVGNTEVNALDIDILLGRYTSEGEEIFFQEIGREGYVDFAKGLDIANNGGFVVIGFNSFDPLFGLHDVTLIQTDEAGNIFSNYVEGKVYFDQSGDCSEDVGEPGLTEWLVIAEGEENTFYGSTDAEGNYSILLDTGNYDIRILPKNNYWQPCVEVYNGIELGTFYDTTQLNFPINDVISCPFLNVDVSTPSAQSCAEITYTVSYCNDGTQDAIAPEVQLTLDEDFTFLSASQTVSSIAGNILNFSDLANVAVGECTSFTVTVSTDCASQPLSAYSIEAHITPDENCLPIDPNWDGASLDVDGFCDGDSIRFSIQNLSDDNGMSEVLEYIIIEDIIIGLQEPYQLGPLETEEISVPATGSTYRLVAQQTTGHPGNSYPTVAVEGCAVEGEESSTGNVTIFPEDENDSFVSVDVQQIGNENTLNGYPTGYPSPTSDDLLLAANTPIQYHLRFENTTDYIVNRLVIRDTLDLSVLDITTLESGASDYAYETEVYFTGVVKFIFNDMNLLPGENGFIQFKINQQQDLAAGTRIANSADVYLGYEEAVRTNEVVYHIGGNDLTDFVTIDIIDNTVNTLVPNVTVDAFPNPFTQGFTLTVEGIELREATVKIYDDAGRLLTQKAFTGSQVHIERGNLPRGTIFFVVESEGKKTVTGKAIVN